MKLKITDGNKLTLQCVPGDKYYTIERVTESKWVTYMDGFGEIRKREERKTVGKEIVEHTWRTYAEIVQAIECGRVGKNIFLKREAAERKFEKYWEKWWGQ